jgi:uncharacterized protein YecT (DUF1311 family)
MMQRGWLQGLLVAALACSSAALALPVQAGGGGQVRPGGARPAPKAAPAKREPRADVKEPAERALLGQWEVTRVLPDLADQPHWGVRPDDPSILFRSMTIAQDKIRFVGDDKSCDQPRWQSLATTWQALFQKTGISRTPSNSAPARATPEDYGLKVAASQRAQAFLVCPSADVSPAKAWRDAGWMALQSEDELVVRYSQQVLVVLRRRSEGEPPRASFACEKASSPAEKTICSDVELAAWDRSVAEALRQVLDYKDADEKARVLREHVAWKVERDKCGNDRACLAEALSSRTGRLIQE